MALYSAFLCLTITEHIKLTKWYLSKIKKTHKLYRILVHIFHLRITGDCQAVFLSYQYIKCILCPYEQGMVICQLIMLISELDHAPSMLVRGVINKGQEKLITCHRVFSLQQEACDAFKMHENQYCGPPCGHPAVEVIV